MPFKKKAARKRRRPASSTAPRRRPAITGPKKKGGKKKAGSGGSAMQAVKEVVALGVGIWLGDQVADAPKVVEAIKDDKMRYGAMGATALLVPKMKGLGREVLKGFAASGVAKVGTVMFPNLKILNGASRRIGRLKDGDVARIRQAVQRRRLERGDVRVLNGRGDVLMGAKSRNPKIMGGRKSVIMGGGGGDFDMFT